MLAAMSAKARLRPEQWLLIVAVHGVERDVVLASQLQRQSEQSEREIAQLRESQAATAAALRHLETRREDDEKPPKSTGQ